VLREASESERLELSRKLEDLFFNEERPYDKLRLGLPGWKSRFYREYFGVETSNEIGNLQNDMVMFSLCLFTYPNESLFPFPSPSLRPTKIVVLLYLVKVKVQNENTIRDEYSIRLKKKINSSYIF
jgi:hypothetical protein